MIDDAAIAQDSSPEDMIAIGVKRHSSLIGDLCAIGRRGLAAIGGIYNHCIAVAGRDTRRDGVIIGATGLVNRDNGVVERLGISRCQVMGHTIAE